jgi:regulator of protease activity HflC (stomatin/prohibitin superfamily)
MSWLQVALDFLYQFWPFVQIDPWERGVMFFSGRVVKPGWFSRLATKIGMPFRDETGHLLPGTYFFIPWLQDVSGVDVVPVPIGTPMLNITLDDKRTLSFSVTFIVRVFDPTMALCEVDDYKESTGEIIASKVAEKLMEVDATRIDSEKRKRLLSSLRSWVNDDTEVFGVEVLDLRFPNFAVEQKAYRILSDTALASIAW